MTTHWPDQPPPWEDPAPAPVFVETVQALDAINRLRSDRNGADRTPEQAAAEQHTWAALIDRNLAAHPELHDQIAAESPDGRRRLDARYDINSWANYDDDLVAAWAADAMDRKRAYAVYGSNVEAPDAEDE